MRLTLMVVDDFLDNPDEVRARVLKRQFARPAKANYPGRVFYPDRKDWIFVADRIARLVGQSLTTVANVTQGDFRITTAIAPQSKFTVHRDQCDLSAVLYLSRGHCGTSFYRHRKTGLDRASGLYDDRVDTVISADTHDRFAWDEVRNVDGAYNRLVLFDGSYIHAGAWEHTGKTKAEGRLTQHFFFNYTRGR